MFYLYICFIYRESITCEITSATVSSAYFIVYRLNKNPTYLSLHEVLSLFSGMPILVLSCTNGFVRARCSMPQVCLYIGIYIDFGMNYITGHNLYEKDKN